MVSVLCVKVEKCDSYTYTFSYPSGVKCEWSMIRQDDRNSLTNRKRKRPFDSDEDDEEGEDEESEDGSIQAMHPTKKIVKFEEPDEEEAINECETAFAQLLWTDDMDNLTNMMRTILEPQEVFPVKQEPPADHKDIKVNATPKKPLELFFDDDLPDLDVEDEEPPKTPPCLLDIETEVTQRLRPPTPIDGDADCDSNDTGHYHEERQPALEEPEIEVLPPEPKKPVETIDLSNIDPCEPSKPAKPPSQTSPPPTPKPQNWWKALPFLKLKEEPSNEGYKFPVNSIRPNVPTATTEVVDLCDSSDEEEVKPRVPLTETAKPKASAVVEEDFAICISDDDDEPQVPRVKSPEASGSLPFTPDVPSPPCPPPEDVMVQSPPCQMREEEEEEDYVGPEVPKMVSVRKPWFWVRRNERRTPVIDFNATENRVMKTVLDNEDFFRFACDFVRTMTTESHRPPKWVKVKLLEILRDSTDKDRTDLCYSTLRHVFRYHSFVKNNDAWPQLSRSVQRLNAELKNPKPTDSVRANVFCVTLIADSVEKNLYSKLADSTHNQRSSALMAEFFGSKIESLIDWLRWCIIERWDGFEGLKMQTLECLQLLVSLPLVVCNDAMSHAANLARSLALVYLNLPTLEARTLMLSTVNSPLLLVQTLANVLDCSETSLNSVRRPLAEKYAHRPTVSLDKIVNYYFVMRPLHQPPTESQLNGNGHGVAVEELAMILNMLLNGYFVCKEEKHIRPCDADLACVRELRYHLRALKEHLRIMNGGTPLSDRVMFLLDSMEYDRLDC